MVVKIKIRAFAMCVLVFLCAGGYVLRGQSLPNIPDDKSISSGLLPNGMTYYIHPNKSVVGMLDISLVQKVDPALEQDAVQELGRARFSSMCFDNTSLQQFLGRCGIHPDSEGFIRSSKGSVEYRFGGLSTAYGDRVVDSTLFAVFGIASASVRQGQGSASQAVIVSGDVDKAAFLNRMQILSVCCPKSDAIVPLSKYVWDPSPDAVAKVGVLEGQLSGVGVTWKLERTPQQYMKTVLPVISQKIVRELELLLRRRLAVAMKEAGIDHEFAFEYRDSGNGMGDDIISVKIFCEPLQRERAAQILSAELVRLCTWGVDEKEYGSVREACRWAWKLNVVDPVTPNHKTLYKCKSAFLYGASLATDEHKMSQVYKPLADSTRTRLFNNFIKPVVSQSVQKDESVARYQFAVSDEAIAAKLVAQGPVQPLKLPKDKTESQTGGQFWTFSNGVNVVYKQMATKGFVHYSYGVKGCRGVADKSAFASLEGVPEDAFKDFLASRGIVMDVVFNPTDIRMEGSVPTENVKTMLDVVAALAGKPQNRELYSDRCYKLLVMVGDMQYEDVKKMMGAYVSCLGEGGTWTSSRINAVAAAKAYHSTEPGVMLECSEKLDITSSNFALQNVAKYAIANELSRAFSSYAVCSRVTGDFVGFPSDKYVLRLWAAPADVSGFALDVKQESELGCKHIMAEALNSLSSKPLDAARLKVYKAMARDDFNSYRVTPRYYVRIACDRYLDNRNLTFNYETAVNTVSAERLQKFFRDAASSNSNR